MSDRNEWLNRPLRIVSQETFPPAVDPSDPLVQRIAELERQIHAGQRVKLRRGIRVNPYITVMALGRLCEKHRVVAHVGWTDGMLEIDLVPCEVEVIPC